MFGNFEIVGIFRNLRETRVTRRENLKFYRASRPSVQ